PTPSTRILLSILVVLANTVSLSRLQCKTFSSAPSSTPNKTSNRLQTKHVVGIHQSPRNVAIKHPGGRRPRPWRIQLRP
ncbi:hypothetical protein J3E74DRAFT_376130, partial [Bipolaris maydis]